ncbi:MAG: DNA repair protein RadC, partial [Bacteroidota bacterium]|nr:DNA repair protein RadC [Bacteroidota bacterium]
WHQLYQMEVKDLCQVSGLGPSKAAKIIAALELSKRIQFPQSKGTRLVNSSMVFHFMKSKFFGLSTETFWMICLNQQSKVIDVIHLFSGGLTSTIVDVRVIFQKLISNESTSFIILHNHPSGNIQPSQSDISITKKLLQASKIFDIKLLDHLIIADNSYFSFKDHNIVL